MSDDLDRAVDARIDAYRPAALPPFSAIEARKRGRDRRRAVVAGAALSAVALAGAAVVVPSFAGGGDWLTLDIRTEMTESSGTTADTLRALTGRIGVNDEVVYGSIEEQAAAASVVVVGPVMDITDLGPADTAGSVTHIFRLTVNVEESIKGGAADTVNVTTFGVGNAGEMRRSLTPDAGLWMLARGGGDELVPVESAAVLFEEDGVVVAPLAEARVKPDAKSLDDAIAKSRDGAMRP
jgi:hypothetical protein